MDRRAADRCAGSPLVEEVKIGFREWLPLDVIPLTEYVVMKARIFGFCFTTLIAPLCQVALTAPLAWLFAAAMVVRRRHFPDGVTSCLLLLLLGYLVVHLAGLT